MMARIGPVVLIAGLALGCGSCSTESAGSATAPAAVTEATTRAGGYTHEGAVRLYRAARYQEAEGMCLAAIAEIEKSKGEKSAELAPPLDDLAMMYLRQAKFNEAKPVIERAESVLDKSKPSEAILLGRLAINKGWRLYSLGEIRAAERVFTQGRNLIQKNQKDDSVELAELINNLGLTVADSEDPDKEPTEKQIRQAKVYLLKGWEMRRKLTGDESAESAESLGNIGLHILYHGEGEDDLDTATKTLKKSLEISEKVYGKDNPDTAVALVGMAIALKAGDDNEGAEKEVRLAIPITEKWLGKNHPDRAYELQVLASIEKADGRYDDAEANLLEAVRIFEVTYGPNHPNVANPLDDLKDLYEERGYEAKLKAVQERIDKLRGKEI